MPIALPRLAVSEQLAGDPDAAAKPVQELLKALVKDEAWRGRGADPQLLGSAIERAGFHADGQAFYAQIRAGARTDARRRGADIRWAACGLRQVGRLADRGDNVRASRLRAEIERRLASHNLRLSDVPRGYPLPAAGDRAPAPRPAAQASVEHALGDLRLRWFAVKGRLNIESADGNQARVSVGDRTVDSSDVTFESEGRRHECGEWSLAVEFPEEGVARLSVPGDAVTARVGEGQLTPG